MKKNQQNIKVNKLCAAVLLVVFILALAKLNVAKYISDLLVLVILYVVSLPVSYAMQYESSAVRISKKAVYGFAVVISLAALMAFYWLNLIINGL